MGGGSFAANDKQCIAADMSSHLLHDIYLALHDDPDAIDTLPAHKAHSIRFYLIACAGAFVAACDGFDAINTLLSTFFVFPALIIPAAIIFSALSVLFFSCLNIERIAEGFNLALWAPKLLDLYFLQLMHIKAIHKKLSLINLADLSLSELHELQQVIGLVHKKYLLLINDSTPFLNITTNGSLSFFKKMLLGIAGVFFFSTGFSTGQSVIAAFLALFFVQTTLVLPVFIFALSVALAAFSFFWWGDKQELNKSVSSLLGFNEEKIMQLCEPEHIAQQEKELQQLEEQISSMLRLKEQRCIMPQPVAQEAPAVSVLPSLLFFKPQSTCATQKPAPATCSQELKIERHESCGQVTRGHTHYGQQPLDNVPEEQEHTMRLRAATL